MAASVTIEHSAFSDRRIAYLGEHAGYSHMEALGRMATLWSRCTELLTDKPGTAEIEACIGRDEALLLKSGLGELTPEGVRVRGCQGRTEWYADIHERNRKGGEVRATTAARTQRGRFARSNSPADDQPPPAPIPRSDPDQRGPDLDPPPDELPDPGAIACADLEAPAPAPAPQPPPNIPMPGQGRDARVQLNTDAWRYAAMKHAELSLPGSLPWPVMPVGEAKNELVARTREVLAQHDPPRFDEAKALITRRIEVAFAAAKREGHAKWFTPMRMWDPKSFWLDCEITPEQAAQPRSPPPRGSLAEASQPRRIPRLG